MFESLLMSSRISTAVKNDTREQIAGQKRIKTLRVAQSISAGEFFQKRGRFKISVTPSCNFTDLRSLLSIARTTDRLENKRIYHAAVTTSREDAAEKT